MADVTQDFPYFKYSADGVKTGIDHVIREMPLTIYVNGEELVTLLCSPERTDELTAGFLWSEGVVDSKDEITKIVVDEPKGAVWADIKRDPEFIKNLMFKRLITSGCGKGTTFYNVVDSLSSKPVQSTITLRREQIIKQMAEFQTTSELYKSTHGVHSAALCSGDSVIAFREDIGRHNAVDKILGYCLLNGIDPTDHSLITSGRVSSEVLLKAAKKNIPVLISRTSPTDLAVRLADKLNVTLVCFVRGGKMTVFAHNERIEV
jgi:FdhD protein